MFGNNRSEAMPKETTDTILDKLKHVDVENIDIRVNDDHFLVPVVAVKTLAWNGIPDWIKDEHSEEAKKNSTLRVGIKTMLRPMLPGMLKKMLGQDITIVPQLNILNWLPSFFVHLIVNGVASKGWVIHVEKCEGCEGNIFKVLGVSPAAEDNNTGGTAALPAASSANNQPVSGRGQSGASGTADSDES